MNRQLLLALSVALALGGCVEQRATVKYAGLGGIGELTNLEPRLAAVPAPEFVAPRQFSARVRPLTADEKLALNVRVDPLFMPDQLGLQSIESQFVFLTQALRPDLEKWLERSEAHMPLVRNVLAEAGLPEELAFLPFIESGFSPDALSRAGARGMWQFMPETGRRFGLACCDRGDERTDPVKSSVSAAAYLRELYLQFGDWSLALAAYNAGENKIEYLVRKTGARDFFQLARANSSLPADQRLVEETLHYVPRFIAMTQIIKNLERLGFERPDWYRG